MSVCFEAEARAIMSAVWKYFKVNDENDAVANCQICKIGISRGGKDKAAFNTTNLIRHLKNKHPTQYTEFTQATKPKVSQPTVEEAFKKREKMPRDCEKAKKITEKIAEMIAMSDQPLSLVDDPGFVMLMEYVEPRYDMPSRHYFSEKALPALQKKISDKLLVLLKDVPDVAFTTDIWSSSVSPMSLLSLTAQWINSSFVLRRATLHAQEFRGSHTAERIQQAMEKMLNNWGIDKNRVHVILRDNAANMKKAMLDMGVQSVGCVAHTFQLVVHEGLLSQRSVIDTLANARKIVGHFKHSPLAYSHLEDIQMDLNMDVKRLQQDVQTRWNSSLYMLQSLLEQKRALSVYAAERTLPATLTANQWELMTKTAEVLVPFEELTRDVSRETASAADVLPAITVLRRVLSREEEHDQGIRTMKRTLLEAVEKRFANVETEPLFYMATLLDPRYKDGFFTKSAHLTLAKDHLIQEVAKKTEERRATTSKEPEAAEPVRKSPRHEGSSSLASAFEEILQERQSQARSHEDTSLQMFDHLVERNGLQKEMERYGLVLPEDQTFIKEMIVGLDPKKVDEWPYEGRPKDKSFLYEIVANKTNGVDVDKFDYFARDCHHLGIQNNFDHLRYFKFARVCEVKGQKHICSRDKEVNNLYDMFHTRYSLHRRAYQHSVNKIVEFMIAEAFAKADKHIKIKGSGGEMFTLSGAKDDMEAYTKLTDDVFHQILNSSDQGLAEAREILHKIITRNHYKLLAETKCKPSQVEILDANWKEELTEALQGDGLNPEDFEVLDSTMDYGSNNEDPIENVYFYSKRDPDTAFPIPRERVSSLLPTCFSETLIGFYCKKTDEEPLECARVCFRNWCEGRGLPVPQVEGQEAPQQNPGGE